MGRLDILNTVKFVDSLDLFARTHRLPVESTCFLHANANLLNTISIVPATST
jgi:hypothetical protein